MPTHFLRPIASGKQTPDAQSFPLPHFWPSRQLGPQTPPAPGPNGVARQEVTFAVSYEFLKLPVAPSGVIASVPLDVELSRDHDPTKLIAVEFGPHSLADFEVVAASEA